MTRSVPSPTAFRTPPRTGPTKIVATLVADRSFSHMPATSHNYGNRVQTRQAKQEKREEEQGVRCDVSGHPEMTTGDDKRCIAQQGNHAQPRQLQTPTMQRDRGKIQQTTERHERDEPSVLLLDVVKRNENRRHACEWYYQTGVQHYCNCSHRRR